MPMLIVSSAIIRDTYQACDVIRSLIPGLALCYLGV
jgi:hypothetical protein